MPDAALVEVVERSTAQVRELLALLPGHAPWGAQADAALATVALHRGDVEAAAAAGGAAFEALQAGLHEDTSLDIVLPAARALLAGGSPDVQAFVRDYLRSLLSRIAQGTADETIRVRWLTGPVGRQLVELAGVAGEGQGPEVVGEVAGSRRRAASSMTNAGCSSSSPRARRTPRSPPSSASTRRRWAAAWHACRRSWARRAGPRRRRSPSAGSRP